MYGQVSSPGKYPPDFLRFYSSVGTIMSGTGRIIPEAFAAFTTILYPLQEFPNVQA